MTKDPGEGLILDVLDSMDFSHLPLDTQLVCIRAMVKLQREQRSDFRVVNRPMSADEIGCFILGRKPEMEPGFETHLNTLVTVGYFIRDADGAYSCALLQKGQTRAEASRNNGLKGGRPRKIRAENEQSAKVIQLHDASNRKPATSRVSDTTTTTKNNNLVSSGGLSRNPAIEDIVKIALETAGLRPTLAERSYEIVKGWIDSGVDEQLIIDIIKKKTHNEVATLKYFNKPIEEAIEARPVSKPAWKKAWDEAYHVWDLVERGFKPAPDVNEYKRKYGA